MVTIYSEYMISFLFIFLLLLLLVERNAITDGGNPEVTF
jgi:hypothetical protein